ncbi:MAG TPA: exonuclease SbcC [Nitrosopumilaceae archaeon]|nr:exonuclease SbcC [Nitrosopumilaceae archaeon]
MVFGWGKKKLEQAPEEISQDKEINLSDVQNITLDLLTLRKTQTLNEVKSLRNYTSPLIKELANIAKTLEKDDLKVEDIDKHLRIIVVRGKKQVINVIKKDSTDLPEISSFEDILDMSNILNQKLKKIGDVLGRQTRVIHIFAKKYAAQLKEILAQMNSNHSEVQNLIKNFQDTTSASDEITELLDKIKSREDDSVSKNKKILELEHDLDSFQEKLKNLENSIKKIKSSDKYSEFIKLNQKLSSFSVEAFNIKNEINTQFTKISRALSRYEYTSALDRDQKFLLTQLINDPFSALTLKNEDSIIVIFENVKKGITSGSISVKDNEKTMSNIAETEEILGRYIKKINLFTEQKNDIQNQLSIFDKSELSTLEKDLEKNQSNQKDCEFRLSSLRKEIDENHASIPELVMKIEKKLKKFSKTDYHIINQTQN